MTRQYRTREGEATAVDTKTQLTTLGSESAPGPLLVPAGVRSLVGCYACAVPDGAVGGSASAFVRLEGPGLPGGPETVAIGAFGTINASSTQGMTYSEWYPLNVPVTPGNEILIFLEMAGADIGQVAGEVTLVFE